MVSVYGTKQRHVTLIGFYWLTANGNDIVCDIINAGSDI